MTKAYTSESPFSSFLEISDVILISHMATRRGRHRKFASLSVPCWSVIRLQSPVYKYSSTDSKLSKFVSEKSTYTFISEKIKTHLRNPFIFTKEKYQRYLEKKKIHVINFYGWECFLLIWTSIEQYCTWQKNNSDVVAFIQPKAKTIENKMIL